MNWPTISSTRYLPVSGPGTARPNCLVKVSQWCWAFQATFRPNRPAAITQVSQGQGRFSSARPSGVATSQRNTPGARNRAEYFDRVARPAADARREPPERPSRLLRPLSRHQSVAIQNRVEGASGTARITPKPISRVALNQTAARAAIRSPAPASRAASHSRSVVRLAPRTGNSRTPSASSPAISRPSAIHQAIIGGWS